MSISSVVEEKMSSSHALGDTSCLSKDHYGLIDFSIEQNFKRILIVVI